MSRYSEHYPNPYRRQSGKLNEKKQTAKKELEKKIVVPDHMDEAKFRGSVGRKGWYHRIPEMGGKIVNKQTHSELKAKWRRSVTTEKGIAGTDDILNYRLFRELCIELEIPKEFFAVKIEDTGKFDESDLALKRQLAKLIHIIPEIFRYRAAVLGISNKDSRATSEDDDGFDEEDLGLEFF